MTLTTAILSTYVHWYVCIYLYVFMHKITYTYIHVRACACGLEELREWNSKIIRATEILISIYVCVCVCTLR